VAECGEGGSEAKPSLGQPVAYAALAEVLCPRSVVTQDEIFRWLQGRPITQGKGRERAGGGGQVGKGAARGRLGRLVRGQDNEGCVADIGDGGSQVKALTWEAHMQLWQRYLR
jgi:hypothetical protein